MKKRGGNKAKPKPKTKKQTAPPPPATPRNDPTQFCKAMDTWAQACMTALATDDEYKTNWRKEFSEHWQFIRRSIGKSCLLDRLIYGGEELRTEICPVHQGRWSGCDVSGNVACGCGHGICVTGWLKNKGDPESHNSAMAVVTLDQNNVVLDIKR